MTNQPERFLKMKSGAVYRYSEALAKRPNVMVVDGYMAAEYFRKLGVDNDITKKYPTRDIDAGAIPETPRKPPRNQTKRAAGRKPKVVVSDEEKPAAEMLEELIGEDAKDV